ncbi:hypothetical protein GCM10007071_04790 [Marinobacter zhanjiangensis]|uniref:Uncharacterized protein n=1 Tax=Marinobacter zhanjiangensis TaxID=578215 RepID=A0ABQ3ANU7_9GAMM|nr:hypothetical protein GCM10007071_04790 [Marinobacter zhanjiangensis]
MGGGSIRHLADNVAVGGVGHVKGVAGVGPAAVYVHILDTVLLWVGVTGLFHAIVNILVIPAKINCINEAVTWEQ